jgi:hypothetical protein
MPRFGDVLTTDVVDTGWGGSWDPPACKVSRKTTQALTINVPYTVTFDATTGNEDYKTVAGMHSTAVNTNRIVATQLGLFLVKAQLTLSGAMSGMYSVFIDVVVPSASQTTTYEIRANGAYQPQSRFAKPVLVDVDPNTYVSMRVTSTVGTTGSVQTVTTWLGFRAIALG